MVKMMRLIDADALECDTEWSEYADDYISYSKFAIDNAPTIDAVPHWIPCEETFPIADVAPVRHGHWIEYGENEDGTHNICCSVCDGFIKSKGHANSCYTRNKYRYCHNCGARMDAKE